MTQHPESQAPEKSTDTPQTRTRPLYRDLVLLLTVPSVFAIDQISKQLVRANLSLGESWPATGLVRLTHGTNTGTAFGLFPNQTFLLIIASLIAIGFLVYFYRAHALPRPILRFAIGLQLGGALGNLIDRLRTGAVVDFIDVGRWPIFNVADSSIVVGMALLIGILVLSDRGPHPSDGSEPGPPSDGDNNTH